MEKTTVHHIRRFRSHTSNTTPLFTNNYNFNQIENKQEKNEVDNKKYIYRKNLIKDVKKEEDKIKEKEKDKNKNEANNGTFNKPYINKRIHNIGSNEQKAHDNQIKNKVDKIKVRTINTAKSQNNENRNNNIQDNKDPDNIKIVTSKYSKYKMGKYNNKEEKNNEKQNKQITFRNNTLKESKSSYDLYKKVKRGKI